MICSAVTTLIGPLVALAVGGGVGALWGAGRARSTPLGMPTADELRRLRADLEAAQTEAAERQAELTSLRRRLGEHRPDRPVDGSRSAPRATRRVQPPRPPAGVHAGQSGPTGQTGPTGQAGGNGLRGQLARRRAGGVASGP